jgi:hypothetical protein
MLGLRATDVNQPSKCRFCFVALNGCGNKAYDCGMMDANHISERLSSLKSEISDLKVSNARYWNRTGHTALEKSASALRRDRLVEIKLELSDMRKRCAL